MMLLPVVLQAFQESELSVEAFLERCSVL
jgi:hypothetical protein